MIEIMKRWKIFLVLCINLCWLPIAHAVTATASVSTSIVAVDQAVQLVVSIDKRVPSDAIDFDALSADFVVGRPNVSTNYQNINGKSSIKTEWKIAIAAKRSGSVTIPSFDIDGYKTQVIQLDVRDNAQSAQDASQKKDIIMRATLDRAEFYEGETAQLHLTMYLGIELQNARIQSPQGEGLEIKQVGTDKQYRTQISGRNYMGVDVVYQVTPTKAGKLNIHGAVLSGEKVTGRGGFFDQPTLALPVESRSQDLTINILPKPETISGLWLPTEKLTVTQSWEPDLSGLNETKLNIGSPIERNIELRAVGVDVLKMPKIQFNYPQSVKVYDEKPEFSVQGDETVMRIKQVIIPREQGEISLPSLDIDWFNSKTHRQEKSHIDGLIFNAIADPEQKVLHSPQIAPIPAQAIPAVEPEYECPTTTEIESTPIYWIIASISFALLWLVTLFFYFRKTPQIMKQEKEKAKYKIDIKYCQQLIHDQDDIALVQYIRGLDLSQYSQQLMSEIEQELEQLQASRYSKKQIIWSGDKLLHVLKRLNAIATKNKKEGLAKL